LNEMEGHLMNKVSASLQALIHLIMDDDFVIAILAVVIVATVLAFGFGAAPEIVAAILILGFVTALAEGGLRPRK
jgi:hypothetical protein